MLGSEYIKALLGPCLVSVTLQTAQTLHDQVTFLVALPIAQQGTIYSVRQYWQLALLLVRATAKHSYITLGKSKGFFLSIHQSSPEAVSKQPVIYEAAHITGYILSSLLSHEFCCMEVFFSLLFLISSPWWATPTLFTRQVHDNIHFKILMENFSGLPCFIFMQQLYLSGQCKIISFISPHSSLKLCIFSKCFQTENFALVTREDFLNNETLTGLQFHKC